MLRSLVPPPHKECKQIVYRQINKINHNSLYNDLTEIDLDFNETDMDIAVISYNIILHFYQLLANSWRRCALTYIDGNSMDICR